MNGVVWALRPPDDSMQPTWLIGYQSWPVLLALGHRLMGSGRAIISALSSTSMSARTLERGWRGCWNCAEALDVIGASDHAKES